MASIRVRARRDGSVGYAVLYRDSGEQCSQTFDEHAAAERFQSLVDSVGAARALEVAGFEKGPARGKSAPTVAEWARHHIDHLTGVEPYTVRQYEGYLRNDITPTALGALPLNAVSVEDVALWVKAMQEAKSSGKTIRNKHGFLASVFKSALKKHISENPCEGTRLPRWDRQEMVFLTAAEFGLLYAQIPVFWRPMARFLVSSGTRFSEASALTPADIDVDTGTVRIVKAWKRGATESARVGVPKTAKSVRTINVPADALADLDLSGTYVFCNRQGNAVRANTFRNGVWNPAIERATGKSVRRGGKAPETRLGKEPRIHDLRHTCASWMIARGVPLPVIQDHLGHESITTTIDLYGHLDRSSMQAAAVAIGDTWAEIAIVG